MAEAQVGAMVTIDRENAEVPRRGQSVLMPYCVCVCVCVWFSGDTFLLSSLGVGKKRVHSMTMIVCVVCILCVR